MNKYISYLLNHPRIQYYDSTFEGLEEIEREYLFMRLGLLTGEPAPLHKIRKHFGITREESEKIDMRIALEIQHNTKYIKDYNERYCRKCAGAI